MTIFHVIVLSIVEGITEFLPISSTGHLILSARLLNLPQTDFMKTFEIVIQLGAIAAVVLLYGKNLLFNKLMLGRVLVAFLPTAILGFTLYPFIKHVLFDSPHVIASALLFGGIVLIMFERFYKKNKESTIEDVSLRNSFIIGTIQAISFVPGVSRAAATILGGLFVGLSRAQAVKFSFFLAIPTMLAATGLDLMKTGWNFSTHELTLLSIGIAGSCITALIVITWLMKYIEHHTFVSFGIYRISVSLLYVYFFL